jgi:hypothetical protein
MILDKKSTLFSMRGLFFPPHVWLDLQRMM